MSTRTAGGIPDPRHAADGGTSSASADASTDGQRAVAAREAARVAVWASRDYWWWPRPIRRVDCPLDDVFLAELRKVLRPGRVVSLDVGCSLAAVDRPSSGFQGAELPPLPRFRALAAPRGEVDDSNASSKPSSRLRQLITAPHVIALVPLGVALATLGATAMSAATIKTLFVDVPWTLGIVLFLVGLIVAIWVVIAETSHLVSSSIREPPTQEDLAHALLRDLRHDWRRITHPVRWLRDRDLPRHLPVFVVPALPRDRDDPRGSDVPDDWGTALLRAYQRQNRFLDRSRLRFRRVRLRGGLWRRVWLLAPLIIRFGAVLLAVLAWLWDVPWPLTVLPFMLPLIRTPLFRTPSVIILTDDPDIDGRLLSAAARTPTISLVRPAGPVVRHKLAWINWIALLSWSRIRPSVALLAPSRSRSRPRRLAILVVLAAFAASWTFACKLPGHPYCLGPRESLDRFTSPIADIVHLDWSGAQGPWNEPDGEWIGYRTCLGWESLVQNGVNALAGRMAAPFVAAQTPPEDEPGLFDVDRIYTENRRVEQIHQPGQRIITVALVTSLTTDPDLRRSVVAEREGLAGAYAAQRRLNSATTGDTPLLRLMVVNAGDLTGLGGPRKASSRARAHLMTLGAKLSALAHAGPDAPVAAIVTVNSTEPTRDLLNRFRVSRNRGPVLLSPTMSADGFATDFLSKRFFQVGSINVDQVRLIYDQAAREGKTLTFVYPCDACSGQRTDAPAKSDSYVWTMYCDVLELPVLDQASSQPTRPRGCHSPPEAEQPTLYAQRSWVSWSPRNESRTAQLPCSRSSLVFFGGRYTKLGTFVQDLQRACHDNLPELAVADSGDRLLADPVLARQVPHGTEVLISSRTPLLTCDGLASVAAKPGDPAAKPGDPVPGREADFLDDVRTYLGRCTQPVLRNEDGWLINGWAGSSYDTLRMIYDARRAGCLRVPSSCELVPSLYGASTFVDAGHRPLGLVRVPDIAAGFGPAACIEAYLPQPTESPWTLGTPPEDGC